MAPTCEQLVFVHDVTLQSLGQAFPLGSQGAEHRPCTLSVLISLGRVQPEECPSALLHAGCLEQASIFCPLLGCVAAWSPAVSMWRRPA